MGVSKSAYSRYRIIDSMLKNTFKPYPTLEDIQELLIDLRSHFVDFVTIGQYLQPSIHHEKVHKFYTPNEFNFLYNQCIEIGFKMVSSSPLTRSSYHADDDFIKLKKAVYFNR